MEANDMTQQAKVYSQSALHKYMTGPEPKAQVTRSKANPYRKRQGLMSFFGLNEVLDEVKREEAVELKTQIAAEERYTWQLSQVSEA